MSFARQSARRMQLILVILIAALMGSAGCSLFQPQPLSADGVVQNWLVLRPVPISDERGKSPDDAQQKQAFGRDWLSAEGGEATVQPHAGQQLNVNGHAVRWHWMRASKGAVDLQTPSHPVEYAVAYAVAEIDQTEPRSAFLGLGSDDGVKVWLNGRLVHEKWGGRQVRLDEDLVPIELQAGKNQLVFKVQNGTGPWGLACRVMSKDEGQVIQTVNHFVDALIDGDEATVRGLRHASNDEQARRSEANTAIFVAMANLRKAFDETYGQRTLAKMGFRCLMPGLHLPPQPGFKLEGDHATLSPRGWSQIKLVRLDGNWKEEVAAWSEKKGSADSGAHPLPVDTMLANLKTMTALFNEMATDVRARRYLSAADAFGVLNARLHGLANSMDPVSLANTIDLNVAATRPAAPSLPIIEIRGDAAALGKFYGTLMGDKIRLLQRDYLDKFLSTYFSGLTKGIARQTLLSKAAQFKPLIRPEHMEEIRALARSTGTSLNEVLLGQCFMDMAAGGGCSTIALPADACSDHVARFGRNLDFVSLGILDRHSILLIVHPKDRYAFAAISWPGLVGVLTGMNEHGLSLGCMEVPRPSRKADAMPFMLLYRTILERCKTVDEAIALLEKTPRQTAQTLMLMDASGNRAVTEITPEKVTVRRTADTAALISTNHHRGTDLDSPDRCRRFDYLHDAARREFGQFSEEKVEELLSGASQGTDTLQSVVFEPANRVIYLAVGEGAPNHGFARIDLKPYFGSGSGGGR